MRHGTGFDEDQASVGVLATVYWDVHVHVLLAFFVRTSPQFYMAHSQYVGSTTIISLNNPTSQENDTMLSSYPSGRDRDSIYAPLQRSGGVGGVCGVGHVGHG